MIYYVQCRQNLALEINHFFEFLKKSSFDYVSPFCYKVNEKKKKEKRKKDEGQ